MFLLLLLFSLSIHFSAGFLFPPAGGGCGCAAPCPPPPVCPAMPACPPVQSCPPPPSPAACCPTCSCQKRQKREISNGTYIVTHDHIAEEEKNLKRLKRDVLDDVVKIDAKCNSEHLREIIIQNMDRVTSVAKKRIQSEAETQLDGRYNVICARGDFSYITNTEKFCQETVGDVTCYVFKQLSDVVRARLS